MKQILDPLAVIPGVRRAMIFSLEGVPIVTVEEKQKGRGDDGESRRWADSAEDPSAFAGIAVGWLQEINRTVDPLSWDAPLRVVLQASRGTLILLVLERAILSVQLDHGVAPEELRLPMEAAAARFRRLLRRGTPAEKGGGDTKHEEPRGIFPGGEDAPTEGQGVNESTRNEVPEATRDS